MASLTKRDMEELREFCSIGCDYSDTKTIVTETADESLRELGSELGMDCKIICDSDKEGYIALEDFVEMFYEKISEKILNVVETQGKY